VTSLPHCALVFRVVAKKAYDPFSVFVFPLEEWKTDTGPQSTHDSPQLLLSAVPQGVTRVLLSKGFVDNILYLPPGNLSQWVTLDVLIWSFAIQVTRPAGFPFWRPWGTSGWTSIPTDFSQSGLEPQWQAVAINARNSWSAAQ